MKNDYANKEDFQNLLSEKLEQLESLLTILDSLGIHDKDSLGFLNWFIEVVSKNIIIYKSKSNHNKQNQETYNKARGNVYYIDFGKTIGSEFQDFHFGVVLYELDYTALVVPLTSVKESPPNWIGNTDLIVDIGLIEGFPYNNKDCLAYVGGIQSISKKRLSKYKDRNTKKYYDLRLSKKQFNIILENISKNICEKILTSEKKSDIMELMN